MLQNIKIICQPRFSSAIFLLGFVNLVLMMGCNTRAEGCLDIAAANFDLNADRACKDCCTYPSMAISLSQKWDGSNFSTSDTLYDVNGNKYKIIDLKYYLSSWSWRNGNNMIFTVDSSEISCNTLKIKYTPDILVVDSKQFQYTLGVIRQSPVIDSVYFSLGVVPALDCVDVASTDTPSVLSDRSILWDHDVSSRAAMRLILQRDLSIENFDTLYIHALIRYDLNYDLAIHPGIQTSIDLTVNYAQWFSLFDVHDLNSVMVSLNTGLNGSIFRTP